MKDKLEIRFKELKDQFDIEEPDFGHFDRFKSKLGPSKSRSMFRWVSAVAVAASIILFVGVWIGSNFGNQGMELASVSPEMEETQTYFVTTIQNELETINEELNEDTTQLITDALEQLKRLEDQYIILTLELKESTEDKRIIFAMISNFQQRIEILQDVLLQIENIKQLKTQNNETYV